VQGLSQTPEPDPALIQGAKAGNRAALKSLLEQVSPVIRQWALARTGEAELAADLTQEVLILLVRNLPSFRGESRFLSWVFAVTRNQAIEAWRSEVREERKMDRVSVQTAEDAPLPAQPDSGIDGRRIRNIVAAFLGELPQRQREVFQMAELQGLSSPEIGEILGVKAGSVRAALFKARRTLRRRILEQHPEFVEEYLS